MLLVLSGGWLGLSMPMKVVVSCDKLGRGAYILWTQDCLMGLPNIFYMLILYWIGNPPNWNILVGGGKESNIAISLVTASETDVEQTESRLVICVEMWCVDFYFCTFSDKLNSIWNFRTVEGDSPVDMFCLKYFVIVLE